jgi:hypothetical protein
MAASLRALAPLVALLTACSSGQGSGAPTSDAGADTATADAGDAATHGDGPSPEGSSSDGAAKEGATGTDASPDGPPALTLPSCLGPSAPIALSGTSAYASVQVGAGFAADAGLTAAEPFLVDYASTFSTIDLGAFSPAPAAQGCNPAQLGQSCSFANLSFFGSWGSVVLVTESYASLQGGVRQAGILATDFLSAQPFTLDYRGSRVFAGSSTAFCSDAELAAAGFAPMTTSGFFSHDAATLSALTTVDSAGATGVTVPNVPTVSLRVGGVAALAQLDTGFDDSVQLHSVNINQAFLAALQAQNPGAITRDPSLDLQLTTCVVGSDETVEGYRLAAGSTLDFVSDGGGAARSVSDAILFAKNTPAAAQVCGGIGTWTVPAAQVASSFYADAGAMVFDPIASRVWIPQ